MTSTGHPTLQRLICTDKEINWSAVCERAWQFPNEAAVLFSGKTALQIVVRNSPPLDAVAAIIAAYPRACLRSSYSTSALFDACRCGASHDVIKLILETYLKESTGEKNNNKKSFSPFLWIHGTQTSLDQAKVLLEVHPSGVTERDEYHGTNALNEMIDAWDWLGNDVEEYPGGKYSETLKATYGKLNLMLMAKEYGRVCSDETFSSLHCILRYCLHESTAKECYNIGGLISIISFMRKAVPHLFSLKDGYGQLPLHIVLSHQQSHFPEDMESILRVILDTYPRAAAKEDQNGRMPLHSALMHQSCLSPKCCEIVMYAAPEVVHSCDAKTRFYPFQAAAAAQKCNDKWSDLSRFELVYKMLLEAPLMAWGLAKPSKHDSLEYGRCGGKDLSPASTNVSLQKEIKLLRERNIFLESENDRLKAMFEGYASPRKRSKYDV